MTEPFEHCPYCGAEIKIWDDFPSKGRYYQYCQCGWGRRIPKELGERRASGENVLA